jgi:hypothetical protein
VTDPLVAVQVGAVSFADEGFDTVIDTLADTAAANALFLATPTWTRGTGGRQLEGYPLPDHGVQEYDRSWRGGNYASVHPEFYGNTVLGPVGRAAEHPQWDLLAEVIPRARERGMSSYAWIEESSTSPQLRAYPNFPKVLEVDVWGRPATRPCFNNPDYRNWHLGLVEDYAKSYDLDGLAWCSERPGPLNLIMQGPVGPGEVGCFCRWCQEMGRQRGIDVPRAQAGLAALVEWNRRVGEGDRTADGAFTAFWRILLRHPEVLAWQTLWTDSQWQLYRDIYGIAKAANPALQVGWHLYHNISFSPFYRADQDYGQLSRFSDFLKVVAYNNCAGPRFVTAIAHLCRALFADATPEEVEPLLSRLLGHQEAELSRLPQVGFSPDYVRRETERAVAGVAGRARIYTGIDVDIPVGRPALGAEVRGNDWDDLPSAGLTQCTRESVRDAVLAAMGGGADGVVVSRKYSEMRLGTLAGVGDAIRSASLGS